MFVANYAKTVKPCHVCSGKGCVICDKKGVIELKHLLISEQPLNQSHVIAQTRLVDRGDAVRVDLSSTKELKND